MIEFMQNVSFIEPLLGEKSSVFKINPITLEFSQKVGRILSELPEGRLLQNHYRFYM
jgi:hypothetical protein